MLSGNVAVTDYETYTIMDFSQTPGRKFFHGKDSKEVDYESKEKKMLKLIISIALKIFKYVNL